ncbi:MAG: rhodanese-like domain-containing protein [Candidatus Pacebacteria bacterium]|nr:rhodanese-like domain-containing protein [Candidatus Paceibacterota bacterium]MBP9842988.1 rhodanese-like domain-containing protein [Candidatus Paceibacterota bacterium]
MKKETLQQLIGVGSEFLLLDIRETDELSDAPTIAGSLHMPMGKIFTEAGKGNLPKDRHLVVFCKTGKRAGIVQNELRILGYQVDGLEGGLQAYNAD